MVVPIFATKGSFGSGFTRHHATQTRDDLRHRRRVDVGEVAHRERLAKDSYARGQRPRRRRQCIDTDGGEPLCSFRQRVQVSTFGDGRKLFAGSEGTGAPR